MDNSVISPDDPGGGTLTPKKASRYFEFFRPGTEREVILLGDLVTQDVHYVRSKNHKVLCGARHGRCELCEKAGESDDVSDRHVEFYAASVVKGLKDRDFVQRVAVFTAVAGEDLLRMVGDGSLRSQHIVVTRPSTQKFKIRSAGSQRGLSHVLPAEFDIVPFVRARFGRPQDPARPPVFLPPFRGKDLVVSTAHRPRLLELTSEDCRPDQADLEKLREKMDEWKRRTGYASEPGQPAAPPPPAPAVPTSPTPATAPAAPPPAAPAAAPKPSMVPDPERAHEAARRRMLRGKPAEELTASEAVEVRRSIDYVLGDVVARNGHAGKGGAQ